MKLQILGSAAAEGYPSPFCVCPACQRARQLGGKDLRMRTAYMLDDFLRIDFGPDFVAQTYLFGHDVTKLKYLLLTHSHGDHLLAKEFDYRSKRYSMVESPLTVVSSANAERIIRERTGKEMETAQMNFVNVFPFETVKFPEDDLEIIPLPATHNHEAPGDAYLYIISCRGRNIFIGNDTGMLKPEVRGFLLNCGLPFDVVICDCTFGTRCSQGNVHLGGSMSEEVLSLFRLKPNGRLIVNHFTHNCRNTHAELEAFFNPRGIEVGYDGMTLEF